MKTENIKKDLGVPSRLFGHLCGFARTQLSAELQKYNDTLIGLSSMPMGANMKETARIKLDSELFAARRLLESEALEFISREAPGETFFPLHFNRGAAKYIESEIVDLRNSGGESIEEILMVGKFVLPALLRAFYKKNAEPDAEFLRYQDSTWGIIISTVDDPSTDRDMFETENF